MDDRVIRRFLLGQLPDGEAGTYEERLLDDGTLLAATEAVETELFDQFVRGELDTDERAAFLQRFGVQTERIAFADALMQRTRRKPALRWMLPLAAALAIAVSLLLFRNRPADSTPSVPAKPVAARPALPLPAPPTVKPERIATLSLALTAARDGDPPARLDLSPDVDAVAVHVRIHPADRFPRYELVLVSSDSRVWSGAATHDATDGVTAKVPAAAFAGSGRYGVYLFGVGKTRELLGVQSALVEKVPAP